MLRAVDENLRPLRVDVTEMNRRFPRRLDVFDETGQAGERPGLPRLVRHHRHDRTGVEPQRLASCPTHRLRSTQADPFDHRLMQLPDVRLGDDRRVQLQQVVEVDLVTHLVHVVQRLHQAGQLPRPHRLVLERTLHGGGNPLLRHTGEDQAGTERPRRQHRLLADRLGSGDRLRRLRRQPGEVIEMVDRELLTRLEKPLLPGNTRQPVDPQHQLLIRHLVERDGEAPAVQDLLSYLRRLVTDHQRNVRLQHLQRPELGDHRRRPPPRIVDETGELGGIPVQPFQMLVGESIRHDLREVVPRQDLVVPRHRSTDGVIHLLGGSIPVRLRNVLQHFVEDPVQIVTQHHVLVHRVDQPRLGERHRLGCTDERPVRIRRNLARLAPRRQDQLRPFTAPRLPPLDPPVVGGTATFPQLLQRRTGYLRPLAPGRLRQMRNFTLPLSESERDAARRPDRGTARSSMVDVRLPRRILVRIVELLVADHLGKLVQHLPVPRELARLAGARQNVVRCGNLLQVPLPIHTVRQPVPRIPARRTRVDLRRIDGTVHTERLLDRIGERVGNDLARLLLRQLLAGFLRQLLRLLQPLRSRLLHRPLGEILRELRQPLLGDLPLELRRRVLRHRLRHDPRNLLRRLIQQPPAARLTQLTDRRTQHVVDRTTGSGLHRLQCSLLPQTGEAAREPRQRIQRRLDRHRTGEPQRLPPGRRLLLDTQHLQQLRPGHVAVLPDVLLPVPLHQPLVVTRHDVHEVTARQPHLRVDQRTGGMTDQLERTVERLTESP